MFERSPDSIRELLEWKVEQSPGKEFLFVESDGRVFTYREFDQEVNRAAHLLRSLNVTKGERVSLLLTNSAEYLIFYFACFKIGAWAGPVNALLKPREIEFIISDSEARTVVTQSDLLAALAEVRAHVTSLCNVVVIEDSGRWSVIRGQGQFSDEQNRDDGERSETENHLPATDLSRDDEAVIIYTSGTTGKPKGVLLTHGNMLANAQQIAEWLGLSEEDRSLMIMPLFHVNALMTTGLAALWAGASIVLAQRFSASRHWEMIAQHGVTYFGSVATMLSLLNHTYPDGIPKGLDTSRLRFALCGSAPVPVER
jgi:long-chain acyl-CoA synthetase